MPLFASVPGKRKQVEGDKVPLWGHKAFLLSFPVPFITALAICLSCSHPLRGQQEKWPILSALVWKVGQGRSFSSSYVVPSRLGTCSAVLTLRAKS